MQMESTAKVAAIGAWVGTTEAGYRMSDHNGVFIDIGTQQRHHSRTKKPKLLGSLYA